MIFCCCVVCCCVVMYSVSHCCYYIPLSLAYFILVYVYAHFLTSGLILNYFTLMLVSWLLSIPHSYLVIKNISTLIVYLLFSVFYCFHCILFCHFFYSSLFHPCSVLWFPLFFAYSTLSRCSIHSLSHLPSVYLCGVTCSFHHFLHIHGTFCRHSYHCIFILYLVAHLSS